MYHFLQCEIQIIFRIRVILLHLGMPHGTWYLSGANSTNAQLLCESQRLAAPSMGVKQFCVVIVWMLLFVSANYL